MGKVLTRVSLRQLVAVLSDPTFAKAIWWSSDGTGVSLRDAQTFEAVVLGNSETPFPAKMNYKSFERMLLLLGFHKACAVMKIACQE